MEKSKQSTIKLLNKFSFAQNSSVKLAILTSVLSLTLFFTIAFFSPFKNTLLSAIFPKQSSYATAPLLLNDLIRNGSFEDGASHWVLYLSSPASVSFMDVNNIAIDGKYSANINIKSTSLESWYAQLRQGSLSLVAGKTYILTFWAEASTDFKMDYVLQLGSNPYTVFFNKTANLSTRWQKYSYSYKATANNDNVFVGFNLENKQGIVWIDNVSLISD